MTTRSLCICGFMLLAGYLAYSQAGRPISANPVPKSLQFIGLVLFMAALFVELCSILVHFFILVVLKLIQKIIFLKKERKKKTISSSSSRNKVVAGLTVLNGLKGRKNRNAKMKSQFKNPKMQKNRKIQKNDISKEIFKGLDKKNNLLTSGIPKSKKDQKIQIESLRLNSKISKEFITTVKSLSNKFSDRRLIHNKI